MNIKEIKRVINAGYDDNTIENLIIKILAEDDNVIPTIMDILDYERRKRKKLVTELNFQLSRAHMAIEEPKINEDHFVENEIVKFYFKHKDQVGHCFANMNKYKEPEKEEPTWNDLLD